jgi:hypothetical protein
MDTHWVPEKQKKVFEKWNTCKSVHYIFWNAHLHDGKKFYSKAPSNYATKIYPMIYLCLYFLH